MKKQVMLLFFLSIVTIGLMGCSKEETEIIYNEYVVEYSKTEYSSYIESKYINQYSLKEKDILLVSTGDYVEENKYMFNIDNSDWIVQNIKNNNQLNNINMDIETNNTKLKEVDSNINIINNKINQCSIQEERDSLNEEKKELITYKEEINHSILESQRLLTDLKLDIQYADNKISQKAMYNGQVIINDNVLTLYSTEVQVIYNATQEQVKNFSYDKIYDVKLDNVDIGIAKVNYIIPNDEITSKGINSYYKVIFNIETNTKLLRNNIVTIIDKSSDLFIPNDYVKEDEGKFYVNKNGDDVQVVLEKLDNRYKVISGVKEKDILKSYVGNKND